ncbi:hypothetical protein Pmani_038448 [Petrolisthes manimaculis]|uniref:LRRCT domain-containing protein n=1 Tax=Petrolisthes manimaculis TaxID=1843537 RepID=A0AAE1NGW4_9EUCA|nr:hypothetical protein Pmani_038448 [Petrolisthes manimaculis]
MTPLVMVMVMMVMVMGEEDIKPAPVICSMCECLGTTPFDVDCTTTDLTEVPPMTSDNFTIPWVLDFSNNQIHDVPMFPVLPNLIAIKFKRNVITHIADMAFINLPDLKTLDLQNNNLTEEALGEEIFKGPYNDTFKDPIGLQELDLSYNNIRTLLSHTLHHLPFLRRLFLSHNPLRDISWAMATAITELRNLEELDLSQTQLDRLPSHFITELKHLRVLTLAGNKLTSVPSEVNYAHNLQLLNLNANPIVTLSVGDFQAGLATLRELQLSAMPHLRSVGKETFSSLTNLEVLRMSDNPELSILDPEAFYLMHGDEIALQEIHLQDNHLTTLSETLLPWLQLRYVDLQNNPWNCDCNLKWIATTLIPDLENKNPETTLSIMCAEPIADRGMKMADILYHSHSFLCMAPQPYVNNKTPGALIVATIVIGVIVLLTATMIFSYVLYRRTRDRQLFGERVKYRRAQNEEEEQGGVSHTVQS